MEICSYTFEEYLDIVKSFHGYAAPGVVIGGFMVDLAYQHLPKDGLLDAISETSACLPDAIQLLTPCSIGNGWLKVIDTGRYALIIYEKNHGEGIRVFLDPVKIEAWPEIKTWYFKLTPKKEQDSQLLIEQIKEAGSSICSVQRVQVKPPFLTGKKHRDRFAICPQCGESYPVDGSKICRGCRGEAPYTISEILVSVEASK